LRVKFEDDYSTIREAVEGRGDEIESDGAAFRTEQKFTLNLVGLELLHTEALNASFKKVIH
jgi:hypothetical protein